jgi:hypothetical protein
MPSEVVELVAQCAAQRVVKLFDLCPQAFDLVAGEREVGVQAGLACRAAGWSDRLSALSVAGLLDGFADAVGVDEPGRHLRVAGDGGEGDGCAVGEHRLDRLCDAGASFVAVAATVRSWLRRARTNSEALRRLGVQTVVALDPAQLPTRVCPTRLAEALAALAAAALAVVGRLGGDERDLWPVIAVLTRGGGCSPRCRRPEQPARVSGSTLPRFAHPCVVGLT